MTLCGRPTAPVDRSRSITTTRTCSQAQWAWRCVRIKVDHASVAGMFLRGVVWGAKQVACRTKAHAATATTELAQTRCSRRRSAPGGRRRTQPTASRSRLRAPHLLGVSRDKPAWPRWRALVIKDALPAQIPNTIAMLMGLLNELSGATPQKTHAHTHLVRLNGPSHRLGPFKNDSQPSRGPSRPPF